MVTMTSAAAESYSLGTVIALGLGTVFVGLICIVFLCLLMSAILRLFKEKAPAAEEKAAPAAPVEIPDRGAFIAAVSAAIAEENGTDLSAIRILSVKRI